MDAGADIIIGHHTHTLQPVEIYKGKVIFYSLGNFVFDQGWSKTKDSVLAQFKVKEDDSQVIELIPMKIEEASPTHLTGPLADWNFNRMTKLLTKDLGDDVDWKTEGGKIIINLETK